MKKYSIHRFFSTLLIPVLLFTNYIPELAISTYADDLCENNQHTYEIISTTATCESDGESALKCTLCGHTEEHVHEEALGHDYEIQEISATCTEKGKIIYTCTRCSDTYTEETDALEHHYIETITQEADCLNTGIKTFTCENCGDTYTEEIPMTDHQYTVNHISEPTETSEGLYQYICDICGDTYEKTIARKLPISITAGENNISILDNRNHHYYFTSNSSDTTLELQEENSDNYGNRSLHLAVDELLPIKLHTKTFYYGIPKTLNNITNNADHYLYISDSSVKETFYDPATSHANGHYYICNICNGNENQLGLSTKDFIPDTAITGKWYYDPETKNNYGTYFFALKDQQLYYSSSNYHGDDENQKPYRYYTLLNDSHRFISLSSYDNNIVSLCDNGQIAILDASYCDASEYNLNSKEPIITYTDTDILFEMVSAGNQKIYGLDKDGYLREIYIDGSYSDPINNTKYVSISAGYSHYLAIDTNGNLWSWGSSNYGALGNGQDQASITEPVQITTGTYFTKIAAGKDLSAALDSDYNIYTFGHNNKQQCGMLKEALNIVNVPVILFNMQHIHIYSKDHYVVETEPTCEQDGIIKRTCDECGAVDTIIINATEHSYIDPLPIFAHWIDYKKDRSDAYALIDNKKYQFKKSNVYLLGVKDKINSQTELYAISPVPLREEETEALFEKDNIDILTTTVNLLNGSTSYSENLNSAASFFNHTYGYKITLPYTENIEHVDLLLTYETDDQTTYSKIEKFIINQVYNTISDKLNYKGTCGSAKTFRKICKYCYDVIEEEGTGAHTISRIGDHTSEPGYVIWKCSKCGEVLKKEEIRYSIRFSIPISSSTNPFADVEHFSKNLKYNEEFILPDTASNSGIAYLNLGPFETENGNHIISKIQEVDYYTINGTKYYPGDVIKQLTTKENTQVLITVTYKTTLSNSISSVKYKDSTYKPKYGFSIDFNAWTGLTYRYSGWSNTFRETDIIKPGTTLDLISTYSCTSDTDAYKTDIETLNNSYASDSESSTTAEKTEASGYIYSTIDEFRTAHPGNEDVSFPNWSLRYYSYYIYDNTTDNPLKTRASYVSRSDTTINGYYVYIIDDIWDLVNKSENWAVTKINNRNLYIEKNDPYQLYTTYTLIDNENNTVQTVTSKDDIPFGQLNNDKTKVLTNWSFTENGSELLDDYPNRGGNLVLYSVYQNITITNRLKNVSPNLVFSKNIKTGNEFTSNDIIMIGESELSPIEKLFSSNNYTTTNITLNSDNSDLNNYFKRHLNAENRIDGITQNNNSVYYIKDKNENLYIATSVYDSNSEKINHKEIIHTNEMISFSCNGKPVMGEIVKSDTGNYILYQSKLYSPKYVYKNYTYPEKINLNDIQMNSYVYIKDNELISIFYDSEQNCFIDKDGLTISNGTRIYDKNEIFVLNDFNYQNVFTTDLHTNRWGTINLSLLIEDNEENIHYYKLSDTGIYEEYKDSINGTELYHFYLELYQQDLVDIQYFLEAYLLYAFENNIDISDLLTTEKFYILTVPSAQELKQKNLVVEKYVVSDIKNSYKGLKTIELKPNLFYLDTYSDIAYEYLPTNISAEALNTLENSEWYIKYEANHQEPQNYYNFLSKDNCYYGVIPVLRNTGASEKLKIHINSFSALQKLNEKDLKIYYYNGSKKIDLTNKLGTMITESPDKYSLLNNEHIKKMAEIRGHDKFGAWGILTEEGHLYMSGYSGGGYNGIHAEANAALNVSNGAYNLDTGYTFLPMGNSNTKFKDFMVQYSDLVALDENGNVWTTADQNQINKGNGLFRQETSNIEFTKIAPVTSYYPAICLLDKDGNIWLRLPSSKQYQLSSLFKNSLDINDAPYSISNDTAIYIQLTENTKFTDIVFSYDNGMYGAAIDENKDLYLFGYTYYLPGYTQNGTSNYYETDIGKAYSSYIPTFRNIKDMYPGIYENIKWNKICICGGANQFNNKTLAFIDEDHNLWTNTNGYEITDINVLDYNGYYSIDTNHKLHTAKYGEKGYNSVDSNIICPEYDFKELGTISNFYALTTDNKYIFSNQIYPRNDYDSNPSAYINGLYQELYNNHIVQRSYNDGFYNELNDVIKDFSVSISNSNAYSNNYLLNTNFDFAQNYIFTKGNTLGHGNGFDIEIDYDYLKDFDNLNIRNASYILIESVYNDSQNIAYITDVNKSVYGNVETFLTDQNKTEPQIKSETEITLNTLEIPRVTKDMNGAVLSLRSLYQDDETSYYSDQITLDVVPLKLLKAEYTGDPVTVGTYADPNDLKLTLQYENEEIIDITYDELTKTPDHDLLVETDGINTFDLGFETEEAQVSIPGIYGIKSVIATYPESVWKGNDFDPSKIELTVTYSDDTVTHPTLNDSYFLLKKITDVGDNTFTFNYKDENGYSYSNIPLHIQGYYYDKITADYTGSDIKINSDYQKDDVAVKVYYTENSFQKEYDVLTSDDWTSKYDIENNDDFTTFLVDELKINQIGGNTFYIILKDDPTIKTSISINGLDYPVSIKASYVGNQIKVGSQYQKDDVLVIVYYASGKTLKLESNDWTEDNLNITKIGDNVFTASYLTYTDTYTIIGYEDTANEPIKDPIKDPDKDSDKELIDEPSDDLIDDPIKDEIQSITAVYIGPDIRVNEEYNKDDVIVTLIYKSGNKEIIPSNKWKASGLIVLKEGANEFYASVNNLTASYTVTGYQKDSSFTITNITPLNSDNHNPITGDTENLIGNFSVFLISFIILIFIIVQRKKTK